jgi:predicted RNase H-like HicB family nuclease
MHDLKFTAIFEPAEEGGFIGYVAELPGANTQGETLEETRENLRDALEMILDCYREEAESRLSTNRRATKEELILRAA